MNRKFLGLSLAATLALAMFTSCSDDSSSSGTQAEENVSELTPVNTDPGAQTGDQGTIPGGAENGTISDDPDEPEENVADQPITEDDLKDDGTASVTSLNVDISGVAELGPFADGASVTVNSVDVTTMAETGSSLTAKVAGNLGAYKASGTIGSAVASIEVKGNYLNFTLDEPSQTAGLKALSDLRERKTVNVNVLTRLEYDRVQYLVSNLGLSFTAAKTRAEKEVLAALGFKQDSTMFEDISLYDRTRAGAYLLAITSILLTDRSATDVDAALAAIAADIAVDGTWDDDALKANLADISYSMDMAYPNSVLSEKNGDVQLEYFSGWVDRFWAAQYGLGSCGKSNQDEIKQNANVYSSKKDDMFVCQDSAWSEASESLLANVKATALFGACTESNAGSMQADSEGKYYICKKDKWNTANADDLLNMKIAESKGACSANNDGSIVQYESDYFICSFGVWVKTKNVPIDYSKGRAMNKRLGRGINFGNSWESQGNDDCGWSNCIQDGWFKIAKDAGFNSIRLPVRWDNDASGSNVSSSRLSGVKADINLALAQGMVVIVNFHHHTISSQYSASEKERFVAMWANVAKELNSFDDDKLVLEILNEPHDISADQVNDLMVSAYEVIRKNAPGKTIMFEAGGYSKFAQITKLTLPQDGNIIVSGHYYEPYTFTHQGHGYDSNDKASFSKTTIANDFRSYAEAIAQTFPDINGGCVPMNMGEFGVASTNGGSGVSESSRAQWTDAVIESAEKYGMSWQYWGFAGVGGFEAYNKNAGQWYPEILQVFTKYISK